MPPDLSKKYLQERELIEWLIGVTGQTYKQIYDSINKAIKCEHINSSIFKNNDKYIHVDSFKKWAVSRRRWKKIFSSYPGFPAVVNVTGIKAEISVGNVSITSIPRDGNLAKKELGELQIESSKDKAKIKELEEEAGERKNKSKKMSEYGKKARGKPKI